MDHKTTVQKSIKSPNLKVTLLRSADKRPEAKRKILTSLGLSRIGSSKVLPNVNPILGQINKVIQFIKVEPSE